MDCGALFNCLPGHSSHSRQQPTITEKQGGVITEQPVRAPEDAADDFIDILRISEKGGKDFERRLKNVVSVDSWTEDVAMYILQGVEALVQHHYTVGEVVRDAINKSTDAAEAIFDSAKDHPVLVTIVALGVLAIIAPWVLEALGFGELGPVADTFASWWQARYAGYVPKDSLFSFFQRLGMVWK
ncbi:hypothetical protein diail_7155 [Diaporthe ilicicola]|nr:hypothetical protein diail_7155 [Diaporthe ilicicola]